MVTLRLFREDELDYFDTDKEPSDPYNFFGLRSSRAIRVRWAVDALVAAEGGTLAVDHEGVVIGDVSWRQAWYGPPAVVPPAYNIGISLLRAERGKGYGTLAQRALADYLFGVYAVNRLEAMTDVGNVAEQRALTKAGFHREGVLRGAQFRTGRFRDLVAYSRLREDNPDGVG